MAGKIGGKPSDVRQHRAENSHGLRDRRGTSGIDGSVWAGLGRVPNAKCAATERSIGSLAISEISRPRQSRHSELAVSTTWRSRDPFGVRCSWLGGRLPDVVAPIPILTDPILAYLVRTTLSIIGDIACGH
jgi:hypothetical protein